MRLFPVVLFTVITSQLQAQSCNCEQILEESKSIIEQNYAGWFDKINDETKASYEKWNESFRSKIKQTKTDSACVGQLQQWVRFFKDGNLRFSYVAPRYNADGSLHTGEVPPILNFRISEKQIRTYLGSSQLLDPIEGIYKNNEFTVGLLRSEKQFYQATILSTTNKTWQPQEVKFTIEKRDDKYHAVVYNEKKTDSTHSTAILVDNILDLESDYFEKVFPETEPKRNLLEYVMEKDSVAPSLEFREPNVAVWTFSGFKPMAVFQTQYLLAKHADQLEKATDWIIDLRDNNGEDYEAGMQLLKYVASNPVMKSNSAIRLSKANLDRWYNQMKPVFINADEPTRHQWDSIYSVLKSKEGSFHNIREQAQDTLQIQKPSPVVKRVAVLVNKNTRAAAERLTLLFRQSKKVNVYGQISGGAADYSNVVEYNTACSKIRISLPMDRMLWLNDGFSVDKAGIHPDRLFVVDDWIEAVYKEWKLK